MKRLILRPVYFFLFVFFIDIHAQDHDFFNALKLGSYTPGFQLIETRDLSRHYPQLDNTSSMTRPMRVYIWYPAVDSKQQPILFKSYLEMAAEDFGPTKDGIKSESPTLQLPTALSKGLDKGMIENLLKSRTRAIRDADPAESKFPLIILGQGLYYESPLTHVILCEFLASHGYVIATCPLIGTHCRLTNLNIEDLETQNRDLEFVIDRARAFPFVHPERLGVIGYDLGGMAGLLLSMRNPDIDAFLSLDSGILYNHRSGLPKIHPNYQEERFQIPWMHMTQARFVPALPSERAVSTLFDRKRYGDSYLGRVNTTNHGGFTSYSMLGIQNVVQGYWGQVEPNTKTIYYEICQSTLNFMDSYIKNDQKSLAGLKEHVQKQTHDRLIAFEFKMGEQPPPPKSDIIHGIIESGIHQVKKELDEYRTLYPDSLLFDETTLNWLGYHYLYWWGREEESIELFKLIVEIFPESANAYDSLGEAYLVNGDNQNAIISYQKSLELNPANENAKAVLERLE